MYNLLFLLSHASPPARYILALPQLPWGFTILGILVLLFVVVTLSLTACSDPGIFPRYSEPQVSHPSTQLHLLFTVPPSCPRSWPQFRVKPSGSDPSDPPQLCHCHHQYPSVSPLDALRNPGLSRLDVCLFLFSPLHHAKNLQKRTLEAGGTVVTSNLTSFVLPPILGLGTRESSSNRLAYFPVAFV